MCCRFSCVRLFVTPWTVACQAPMSMGFSKQEYWSGLPCPLLGVCLTQGLKVSCIGMWVPYHWHMDHFKLKLLEKASAKWTLKAWPKPPCEKPPLGTRWQAVLSPETGNLGNCVNKRCYSSTNLNTASPNLFALSFLHRLIVSLSKRHKSCLLWSLL